MQRLSFAQLDQRCADFDAFVVQTPNIDRYCSSSAWVIPARKAFAQRAMAYVAHNEHGYVALMALPVQGGVVGVPLEASWGLASPFVGPQPEPLVDLLVQMDQAQPLRGLFLSGVAPEGPVQQALVRRFGRKLGRRVGLGPECKRRVADIRDGIDGFLGRRTSKFRANLRRAERKALRDGYVTHFRGDFTPEEVELLLERIMDVEGRSWKGRTGQGVDYGEPRTFYEDSVHRLAARGMLRVVLIEREGQDRAFVFGGVLGDTYRGLQVSFDCEDQAYALGNVAQFTMIRALCAEGVAYYDLGTDIPYKHRWSEEGLTTATVAVLP